MRNIPTKNPGDELFSAEFNDLAEESENIITSAGITLSASDLTQLSKAVAGYIADGDFYLDSGAANAYVLNTGTTKKTPPTYLTGMRIRFKAANSNTGASTINVASLGSKSLADSYGNALVGSEIIASIDTEAVYDGTVFRIVSSVSAPILSGISKKFAGCTLANNAGDILKDIDFGAGYFRADNAPLVFHAPTTFVKQLDAVWAPGTAAGGRASGAALANDTWYHCFYIAKPDGTVGMGFDTSITATNLLSDATGYLYYARRISIYTGATSNITTFYHKGDKVYWDAEPFQITTVGAAFANITLPTPPDVVTSAYVAILANVAASASCVIQVKGNLATQVHTVISAGNTEGGATGTDRDVNDFSILSDTNSQIQQQYVGSVPVVYVLSVNGWEELYD